MVSPMGCSGSTASPQDQREELAQVSCTGGSRAEVQCWPPGEAHFGIGLTPNPVPLPDPVFDENGCQVQEQAADGCCNPAQSGPELINGH